MSEAGSRVRGWRPRGSTLALAAILLVAAATRIWDLGEFPTGLHGDEGIAGMEAQRAWDERGIGVYSPLAAGQPTGPLYLMAIPVELMGNTIFAVRIVPALLGVLTVLALYVVMRRNFGEFAALAGAGALAVMGWHIHYARIGFPLEAWPLLVVLCGGALAEAVRTRDWRWWAAAGAFGASGIYVYNAHPAFAAIYGAVAFGWLVAWWGKPWRWEDRVICGATAVLAGVIVLIPMAVYAGGNWEEYSAHFERDSLLDRPEWAEEDFRGRADFLVTGYVDWWERMLLGDDPDNVDAIGVTPVVPWALAVVAYSGICLALLRHVRHPLVHLGVAVVVLLPFASVLTFDAFARRTLAIAPFLAMFAGIFAAELFRLGRDHGRVTAAVAGSALVSLGVFIAWENLDNYFNELRDDPYQRYVFADDLTQASLFMDGLPAGSYILFAADRWSFKYETRRYLAPGVSGEDRSERFGARTDMGLNGVPGEPVFVLIGSYRALLPELVDLYPGGVVTEGREGASGPTFIAYDPP